MRGVKTMKRIRILLSLCLTMIMGCVMMVNANPVTLPDGSKFDAAYYAAANPDVVQSLGNDPEVLSRHYWEYGIAEGRLPYEGASDVSAATLIAQIDQYRTSNGLCSVVQDQTLMSAAQARARELADNELFAHTRPDGAKWSTIFNTSGYARVGENLARGSTLDDAKVMTGWKNSPSHNEIMLHKTMNRIGVGVAKSTSGKFYFCMIVGTSK